ncbi:MAG: MarR family winged helix-turn-helix transcriptional regulator [Planctomycetota bacterium]
MKVPDDTARRLAAALERVERLTRSGGQRAAQEAALSPLQVRLLDVLRTRGAARIGALARELLVTDGTVSEAVRVLGEKRLVVKEQDPNEHRAIQVRLTPAGRRAQKRAAAWPDELLGPVLDELGARESGELLASLLQLIAAMERRGLIETSRMCLHCEHFRSGKGRGAKPHYCALLEAPIGKVELQVDCPDFSPAGGGPGGSHA